MFVRSVPEAWVRQVFVEKLVDFSLLPESKGMKKNFHRIRSVPFLFASLPTAVCLAPWFACREADM
jgi:hypothetical protein